MSDSRIKIRFSISLTKDSITYEKLFIPTVKKWCHLRIGRQSQ